MKAISLSFFLWLLCFLVPPTTWAEEYRRTVNVEWERIDGAKYYDLEWTKVPAPPGEKPFSVQTTTPEWKGALAPGIYQMRIRARDQRKAPGDWSPAAEFKVGLDPVVGHSPSDNEIRKSDQSEFESVTFKWQAVVGAQNYLFEISAQDGSLQEVHNSPTAELTLKLPVAKKYTWSVKAQAGESLVSEKTQTNTFTLLGKKLDSPQILQPDASGALKWTKPDHTENFDSTLLWLNPETGKWELVDLAKDSTKTEIPFPKEWIGGEYAIRIRAKASLREESDGTQARFRIVDVNRAPAAENTFVLRKSWDRREGVYALAQQQLTMLDYSSTNSDLSKHGDFSTLGGHARLGVGAFDNSSLGGLASLELGGLYLDSRTYTASTFELTGIRRQTDESGETRHYFGVFFKELPMLSGSDSISHDVDRVSGYGPHYGYERNWALGSRTGIQANFHAYFSLFKVRTPNGEDLTPTPSLQLGLLGSYKLTSTAVGYYGYTFRMDSLSYRSQNQGAESNKVEMQGHYLNLFLEWTL